MKLSIPLATVLLLAVAVPCSCQGQGQGQGNNPQDEREDGSQYGSVACGWNETTGILAVEIYVVKNDSTATGATLLTELSEDTWEERTESECVWDGDGSDENPWHTTLMYDFMTDSLLSGDANGCGVKVVQSQAVYVWSVFMHKEFPIMQEGDMMLIFTCNISHRLPDMVMLSFTRPGYRLLTNLTQAGGLLRLQAVNNANDRMPVNTLQVGNAFQLELSFQPDGQPRPHVSPELEPWGAYCKRLYVETSDGSRRVEMLDQNACPHGFFMRPSTGFIGNDPDTHNKFRAFTGPIEAGAFDKAGSTVVHIVCEAILCWYTGSGLCYDTCTELTSRGKRTERRYKVETTLTVFNERFQPDGQVTTEDKANSLYIWIIVGVGAGLAVLIISVCTICLLCRMRRPKYKHQHDSYTSSNSIYDRKP